MQLSAFIIGVLFGGAFALAFCVITKSFRRSSNAKQTDDPKPSPWPYFVWPALACACVFLGLSVLLFVLDIDVFDQRTWFQFDQSGAKLNPAEGARDIFLSIGGLTATIVAALTLGNAMRRSATMERQEAIAKRVEANDRRRLAGDTFSNAAELLGASDEARRLGGLHSLELLSRGVDDYNAQQISNTISAFIRARSKHYLDILSAGEDPGKIDCEESLKSAIIILIRRFGDSGHPIDLSNSYIAGLSVDRKISNVNFDESWIGSVIFNEHVSKVSFNRLKGAGLIVFDKGVFGASFYSSKIRTIDIGSMFANDDVVVADMRLSGAEITQLSLGEGVDTSGIDFGSARVQVLYAYDSPTLKTSHLHRLHLDDVEQSYFPQTWSIEEKAALFDAWRERDEGRGEVPF